MVSNARLWHLLGRCASESSFFGSALRDGSLFPTTQYHCDILFLVATACSSSWQSLVERLHRLLLGWRPRKCIMNLYLHRLWSMTSSNLLMSLSGNRAAFASGTGPASRYTYVFTELVIFSIIYIFSMLVIIFVSMSRSHEHISVVTNLLLYF